MSRLGSDLVYAVRSALGQPVFTGIIIVTLALGIGANTAMFATIRAALAIPDSFPEADRLVFAACTFNGRPNPMASAPDFYDYREQADRFETLAAIMAFGPKATISDGRPERAPIAVVSHDFFRMLRTEPANGRSFTSREGEPGGAPVVVISDALARRRFGSAARALDRSITIDGTLLTIVGVMPSSFRFLFPVDVWTPMRRGEGIAGAKRQFHNWLIFGRLKPGVTLAGAREQVAVISRRLQEQYPDSNRDKALQLEPIREAFVGRQLPRITLLVSAVVLLLVIACANVAGMLMARGTARRGELAVRAALGASRASLVAQLLTESMLLALTAGALGTALAFWLQRLLPLATGLTDAAVPSVGFSWPVVAFALGTSVLTGLIFGVAPARRASALDPARDLTPGARATEPPGGARLRSALVVGQVALSLMLLVAAGLLTRNLARLVSTDPGFEVERLLTGEIQLLPTEFPTPAARTQFFEGLRRDLAGLPGVAGVGFTSHLPMLHRYSNWPAWAADRPPAAPADRRLAHARLVLPGYFRALGIPLIAGRDFSDADRDGSERTAVINETMARTLFPGRTALGERLLVDRGRPEPLAYVVIGIVGDARLDTMGQAPPMTMYAAFAQAPQTTMRFAIRTALSPGSLTETVRKMVAARSGNVPVDELLSMEQILARSLMAERVTTATLGAFSAVALLLASVGLYGVLAFYVTQRTHEIGVRISLGADTRTVIGDVLSRTARMVVPGLVLGLGGALAASHLIGSLLFEVTPTDPATIAGVTMVLGVAALAASALPAWRAAHIDPVRALRGD